MSGRCPANSDQCEVEQHTMPGSGFGEVRSSSTANAQYRNADDWPGEDPYGTHVNLQSGRGPVV